MYRKIEKYLLAWKDTVDRLPLLVRGARQVGKSYAVEAFGRAHFANMVVINFEQQREFMACFETLYPQKIINLIYSISGQSITPGSTLLFLDEIQECPNAILALRYFYEQLPSLHVIAAGSLLEFALRSSDFRMPVGRIQSCYLKPISFNEFLLARQLTHFIDYLENITLQDSIEPVIHEQLLAQLREYLVLGGMPAVVNQYLATGQFEQGQIRQSVILDTYRRDFGKYAKHTDIKYLQTLFDKAPGMVSQHFRYVDVDPNMYARDIKRAIGDLKDAGLIYTVYATGASALPLMTTMNEKKFKVLFIDVGLVNSVTRLSAEILMNTNILLVHQGALAEQFVGQELLAYAPCHHEEFLFYWEREQRTSSAEIDYVVAVDSQIFPVEVKAGATGRLRSLQQFINEKKSPFGIRISQNTLALQNRVLSIPLYLISELSRLVKEAMQ
jgi:predicted AAA+ superfamily ATPase